MGHRRIGELLEIEAYMRQQGFGRNYGPKIGREASEEEQWLRRNGMDEGK
jgi:hypothetical protein